MFSSGLNLRFKFVSGLVLFALALGFCISLILYFHFNSIMKSEISQRARMLLAQSSAVQDYVKTELRPEMFAVLPQGRFVLKAMSSSYISREVMGRLNPDGSLTYHYRRVSKRPRNPESTPDSLESSLIALFSQNPHLEIWEDDARVGDTEYHIVAKPVVFRESCMSCHGDPADAPKELLEIYGNENGFHYAPGQVGGVVVAGFPVGLITTPAKAVTLQYLILYLLGILVFAALISLFFDRLVIKNLQNLTTIFKSRFSGHQEQGIIQRLGEKDEIEGLIEGVDELAGCLSEAREELEDYAQNLEVMVELRTREISDKAKSHQADVGLFVEILSGIGGFTGSRQVISHALEQMGQRFGADQMVYHCTVASDNTYTWGSPGPVGELTENIRNILWKEEVLSVDNTLYVPVKTRESHWGILGLTRSSPAPRAEINPSLLLALGRQLAILIDNVQSFSNVRFQNDMLQSVFEGISDPLLLIDRECRIFMANEGSGGILAGETKQEQEKALKKFLCSRDPSETRCNILDMVLEQEQPIDEEIETPDHRFFRVYLYPLPRPEQAGLRIVLYARETTMEKRMMSRMQQAERLSAVGKMAAGVAHEINNPLGVISCYTDLVRDAVGDADTLADLDVIEKHTKGVQKVVQELLKISRPKQAIPGACDINRVVGDAVRVFQAQAGSREIQVETRLQGDLPGVACDAGVLEQILTNLWLNAFDALLEKGGKVLIETGRDKGQVRLTIRDNGPGIPEDVLDHIFDPFFTTKAVGKGTGLGLAVVYGFVTEMGGRIEVRSVEDTCFDIYFPVETI